MNTEMNPSSIIKQFFEGTTYLVVGKQYHSPLPDDLSPWYCYTNDGGHSILALIEDEFEESNTELLDDMVPCPVKSVLRSYRIFNGYPVASLKYDDIRGLITEPEDSEY